MQAEGSIYKLIVSQKKRVLTEEELNTALDMKRDARRHIESGQTSLLTMFPAPDGPHVDNVNNIHPDAGRDVVSLWRDRGRLDMRQG